MFPHRAAGVTELFHEYENNVNCFGPHSLQIVNQPNTYGKFPHHMLDIIYQMPHEGMFYARLMFMHPVI